MSTPQRWDTAYERRAIALLSCGFGLVGLDRWVLPPLFPAIAAELHLNYQDLGNLVGILSLAWGGAAIVFGGLADRVGRKRILVPAVAVFSLLSALSGFATGLGSLLLIRALMGAAEGAVPPTSVAVALEASHPSRIGMNSGLYQSTLALFGLGFAPIIATQLLQITSWRNVFLIVGVPGLIVAVLMSMWLREPGARPQTGDLNRRRTPLSQAFKQRNVWLATAALMCAMTGMFVLSAVTPSYLLDVHKLTTRQMGFVTSGIGFGACVGQMVILTVSDFVGRRSATWVSFGCAAVFLWLFAHAETNTSVLFLLLCGAAFFNCGALAVIAGPIAAEAAPPGLTASVAGLIIGVGDIFGGGIAPAVAGGIAQRAGIQYTPYLALAGLLGGVLVSLCLRETAPRRIKNAVTGKACESPT